MRGLEARTHGGAPPDLPRGRHAHVPRGLLHLRAQQAGARRLPHFLDVPVGHKTGDSGVIANDVGIVYARSGPIVIAFFTNGITGPYAETEDRIGRVARLIVDYFQASTSNP